MGVQELATEIVTQARQTVEQIEEQTRGDLARIAEQTARMAREKRETLIATRQKQQEEELRRKRGLMEIGAAQQVLACKQEILNDTFAAAREALTRLPARERKELLDRMLAQAKAQAPDIAIVAAQHDAAYLRTKARVTGRISGIGGFVAKSRDGTVFIDMRFETLLDNVRARKTPEIAAILFAGIAEKETPAKKRTIAAKKRNTKRKP